MFVKRKKMLERIHKKIIDYLRTKKWFRDLSYRVLMMYRVETEMLKKEHRMKLLNMTGDTKKGYWRLMNAQKINRLVVRYNSFKFWFQKRKDPFVLTKQHWYRIHEFSQQ